MTYSIRSACLFLVVLFWAMPSPAWAMHVSEGILPVGWAGLWYAVTLPFIALGLRNLRRRTDAEPHVKPLVALVGAGVFVISCMPIPVPVAGTCSHPVGTGIAAILIGPTLTTVVASIALVLQALFLAHGGLSTLGANVFAMGVVGAFSGYGAFLLCKRLGASPMIGAFFAGLVGNWSTYAATSFVLAAALAGESQMTSMMSGILLAFTPTQLPLGIVEGFVSAGAYGFIRSRLFGLYGPTLEGQKDA